MSARWEREAASRLKLLVAVALVGPGALLTASGLRAASHLSDPDIRLLGAGEQTFGVVCVLALGAACLIPAFRLALSSLPHLIRRS